MNGEKMELPEAVVERVSPKALLVRVGDSSYWVPRKEIHDDSEVYEAGHFGKLVVKVGWWTEQTFGVGVDEDPDQGEPPDVHLRWDRED